jgi:hypothetical protein
MSVLPKFKNLPFHATDPLLELRSVRVARLPAEFLRLLPGSDGQFLRMTRQFVRLIIPAGGFQVARPFVQFPDLDPNTFQIPFLGWCAVCQGEPQNHRRKSNPSLPSLYNSIVSHR